MDAQQAQQMIEQAGKSARPELRNIESMKVGEAIRQGDIYVRRVAAKPEHAGGATTERQLAPGTTRGSRHFVEGDVEVFEGPLSNPLVGPTFVASKRFRISHPEHAHFSLPAGIYEVTYQRDFEREEIARVLD